MFEHSIPVPRVYKVAAKIVQQVKEELASVKQLVFKQKHINIDALYALVIKACEHHEELDKLLKRSQLLVKEPRLNPWLARVLVTQLLWGISPLQSDCKPVKTVLAYEQIFKAHFSDVSTPQTTVSQVEKPRYVRVNTIMLSLEEAIDSFCNEGWTLYQHTDKLDYSGFLEKISTLREYEEFTVDIHIPNLLIFPPKTRFHNHQAWRSGAIILQDKASCLPVHILGPTPGSTVLDMCAAPGMKTSQMAALLNNEGTIYAVERDEKRYEVLKEMMEKYDCTCVKTINKDVLACNAVEDFPNVEYILVDPSCSGTGMTGRPEFEKISNPHRLGNLAGFQIKLLRWAVTKFPNAKRVVYSTCSILAQENEDVVRQVLETNSLFKLVSAKTFLNDTWTNFGSNEYGEIGEYCLYAKPQEDLTNGFFVAVFERLTEEETNPFFNNRIFDFKKTVEEKRCHKRKMEKYDRKYIEKLEKKGGDEVLEVIKRVKGKNEVGVSANKKAVEQISKAEDNAPVVKEKYDRKYVEKVEKIEVDEVLEVIKKKRGKNGVGVSANKMAVEQISKTEDNAPVVEEKYERKYIEKVEKIGDEVLEVIKKKRVKNEVGVSANKMAVEQISKAEDIAPVVEEKYDRKYIAKVEKIEGDEVLEVIKKKRGKNGVGVSANKMAIEQIIIKAEDKASVVEEKKPKEKISANENDMENILKSLVDEYGGRQKDAHDEKVKKKHKKRKNSEEETKSEQLAVAESTKIKKKSNKKVTVEEAVQIIEDNVETELNKHKHKKSKRKDVEESTRDNVEEKQKYNQEIPETTRPKHKKSKHKDIDEKVQENQEIPEITKHKHKKPKHKDVVENMEEIVKENRKKSKKNLIINETQVQVEETIKKKKHRKSSEAGVVDELDKKRKFEECEINDPNEIAPIKKKKKKKSHAEVDY